MLIRGRFLAGEKVWFQRCVTGPFHVGDVSAEQRSSLGHLTLRSGTATVAADPCLVYFDLPATAAYRDAMAAEAAARRILKAAVKGTDEVWDGFAVRESDEWTRYAAAEKQANLAFRAMTAAARIERSRRIVASRFAK